MLCFFFLICSKFGACDPHQVRQYLLGTSLLQAAHVKGILSEVAICKTEYATMREHRVMCSLLCSPISPRLMFDPPVENAVLTGSVNLPQCCRSPCVWVFIWRRATGCGLFEVRELLSSGSSTWDESNLEGVWRHGCNECSWQRHLAGRSICFSGPSVRFWVVTVFVITWRDATGGPDITTSLRYFPLLVLLQQGGHSSNKCQLSWSDFRCECMRPHRTFPAVSWKVFKAWHWQNTSVFPAFD